MFGLAQAGLPGPDAVSLWDVRTGKLLRHLFTSEEPWTDLQHAPPLDTVAYAPDGASVATNESERIHVLDPQTGETLATFEAPAFVQWLSYSPDGRLLQAEMDGGLVAVWDLRTERMVWSRKVDDQTPLGGEFSADGRYLILGSESGKIHLLDPRTGRPLRDPLLAHDAYLASITVHPDSSMFASSGTDGLTFLWDTSTQRALGSPFGVAGGGGVWSRFSPDGRVLYVSTAERGFVFDTTLDTWIERACSIAGRTLTRTEWERFLPQRPYRPACRTT
ncbi:MAG TPA: WD40 repeat domain-containing protein [Actinomycetota bacterium]